MDISQYERTDKNELFVIQIRLSTEKQIIKRFDDLCTWLIEKNGEPPKWFNIEFWIMTSINQLMKANEPVSELFEALQDRYKAISEKFNAYTPKVSSNEINIDSLW